MLSEEFNWRTHICENSIANSSTVSIYPAKSAELESTPGWRLLRRGWLNYKYIINAKQKSAWGAQTMLVCCSVAYGGQLACIA